MFLANVTFEPGCRNNWHIHHATKGGGQILICTTGEDWYPATDLSETMKTVHLKQQKIWKSLRLF